MDLNKMYDRCQLTNDLMKHANQIIDSMADDAYTDANDWCKLHRLNGKLFALGDLLLVENSFYCALNEMEEMKSSEEDSKWTFPVEKELNSFMKDILFEAIDTLIDCSRSWKFEDYRARNFQNELRQKMEMLRDWYKEAYDSEDDDE